MLFTPVESVSGLTRRMLSVLLRAAGHEEGSSAPSGLPAGALHLPDARLILAATCCTVQLFGEQMLNAAVATGSDVLLMRHGFYPELLDRPAYDVALYLGGQPALVSDMLLYQEQDGGFWLVPDGIGPYIAIEPDGLRIAEEAPYIGSGERADALCRAARIVARSAYPGGRY